MPGRLGLIVNPTSGKNTGARIGSEALTLLRAAGADILDLSAADSRSAMEQGRAAVASGAVDRIVVAGGDGMVHLGANLCAGTGVPLGVIAAGTGNDIARELGLPVRDAAKAVERILAGGTQGRRRRASHDADGRAPLVRRGARRRVRRRRQRAGQPAGAGRRARCATTSRSCASCPCSGPSPTSSSSTGDASRPRRCSSPSATGRPTAAACGSPRTPSFDDGLLDVLLLRRISTPEFLRVFPKVFKRHAHEPPRGGGAAGADGAARGDAASSSYADGERFAPLPLTVRGRARRAHGPRLSADVA